MSSSVMFTGGVAAEVRVREVTTSKGAQTVAEFLAVIPRFMGGGQEPKKDFITVVVWGKQAEACVKFLHRGSRVGVTGRISAEPYQKDGKTVWAEPKIVAENVMFLSAPPARATEAAPAATSEIATARSGKAA